MHRAQGMTVSENHESLINERPGVESLVVLMCHGTTPRRICCMGLEMNLYNITIAENYACTV